MKILLTGACGFVGSSLALAIGEAGLDWSIIGLDNLARPGAELNRPRMKELGVKLFHGDLRCQSDIDALPSVDWIVDAAAQPSVLAGADGQTSSRQLMEHNLVGTINLLEKCKRDGAGFALLSTSRVYSIPPLAALPVEVHNGAYCPVFSSPVSAFQLFSFSASPPVSESPPVSPAGITESFSTAAPISLYGATKLASEQLALEYGLAFDFPVWINRCGVMAGAGQFGRADQGIFAFWIHSHLRRSPLRYIGFGGQGHQVRDCLHPRDLVPLLQRQFGEAGQTNHPRIVNVSGGIGSARSLRQLTDWCDARFGPHEIASDPRPRPFDLPWIVLDSQRASDVWEWVPATSVGSIFDEIARHAEQDPSWLSRSAPD